MSIATPPQVVAPLPRVVLPAVVAYFALHVVARMLASSTVELDEAEQVLLAQAWKWGYGVQPPLYTWLQTGFFAGLGQNVVALSVLKHLLLGGTFLLIYFAAREISDEPEAPLLAMSFLFFVPQFGWESHRDLTHSVAATTCGAGTLLAAVRLFKHHQTRDYVLFGFCAGLGMLAKYNFALFLLALLGAGLSGPVAREAFLSRRMWLAAAVFVVVTAGHFGWLAGQDVARRTANAPSVAAALGYWAKGVFSFSGILLLLMALLHWKFGLPRISAAGVIMKLIGRTLVIAVVLSLMAVLIWQARFKDRWFQPLLFALPLFCGLWAAPRLTRPALRFCYVMAMVVALVTLVAIPAIPMAASFTERPTRLNLPYTALASALRARGLAPQFIAADSRLTGGNLQLHFPSAKVRVPEGPAPHAVGPGTLVIWEANRRREAPPALIQMLKPSGYAGRDLVRAEYIEVPYRYMPGQMARWGYIVLPAK